MSDVEKDTEVTTQESDFEAHTRTRWATDEPDTTDEPGTEASDDSEADFEGHRRTRGD